jgi:GNAT superfamily N-acetyltransferase
LANIHFFTKKDLTKISIEGKTWYEKYFQSNTPENALKNYLSFFEYNAIKKLSLNKSNHFLVVNHQGFCGYCFYRKFRNEIIIEKMYFSPANTRKGYGTAVIQELKKSGIPIRVKVYRPSRKAVRFYQKQQFKITGKCTFRKSGCVQLGYDMRYVPIPNLYL